MKWTDWVGMGSDRTGGWGYLTTYLTTKGWWRGWVERQASAYMYPDYL